MSPPANAPATAQPTSFLVIGVVADVRHVHTDNDLTGAYLALRQSPSPAPFMYVGAAGIMPRIERDLREVIAALDPDLALAPPRPLSDILDQQRAGSRFLASLLVVFALLAAVLALLGIYGVIAYTVRQREREIAIRIAVGADRGMITRMFLRQGAAVVAVGLGLGVGGALLLGRVLETQLFGVRDYHAAHQPDRNPSHNVSESKDESVVNRLKIQANPSLPEMGMRRPPANDTDEVAGYEL